MIYVYGGDFMMNSRYMTKGGAYMLLGLTLFGLGSDAYSQQRGTSSGRMNLSGNRMRREESYKTPAQEALENDMVPVIAAAKSIGNAGKQGLKDVANGGLGLAENAIENAPGVTENIVAAIQDGWANDGKPIYERTRNAGYSGVGAAVASLERVEEGLLVPVVNEAGKIAGDAINGTGAYVFGKATKYGPGVGGWAWDRVKVPATYAWNNRQVILQPGMRILDGVYSNTIGQGHRIPVIGIMIPEYLFPSLHGGGNQGGGNNNQQPRSRWSLW